MDQPEAQLFFGHQNNQSCSKCKRRTGYSCFRKSTCPSREQVMLLYDIANGNSDSNEKAREILKRWGYNSERRCCLLTHLCDKLFIHVPRWPSEVFPCVDYRDRMHGLFIQMYAKVLEAINQIRIPLKLRRVMDARMQSITSLRTLRNTVTQRSYRVQKSLFSAEGLTTVDKICVLFLLPHILGPDAAILPDWARSPALEAISRAQLCVIASRGQRSYTESDLISIYDEGYVNIFRNLETLYHIRHDEKYNAKLEAHIKNPDKNAKPTRFAKKARYSCTAYLCSRTACMYSRLAYVCVRARIT